MRPERSWVVDGVWVVKVDRLEPVKSKHGGNVGLLASGGFKWGAIV